MIMPGNILVRGDGIAALCCVRLLENAGLHVTQQGPVRPKLPAVMLSEGTQKLLEDVFERQDLFDGLPRVRKRIVAWGPGGEPKELPHSSVVISEPDLLDRIRKGETRHPSKHVHDETAWTVFAARPLPHTAAEHHFGSRIASVASAKLKTQSPVESCWIESLDEGWLFLLPGIESSWLLSVGSPVEPALARSRLIADQIQEFNLAGSEFPSHPRIAQSLWAPGWLACGTAALGFDPLCGEGVGHAVREAILACAVVRAVIKGGAMKTALAHYRDRLVAGFHRHLELCEQFYRSGASSLWWDEQAAATRRGIEWCKSACLPAGDIRYRLNGFSLEPID